jgi:peptidoglycan DL-endopeptidase CwlO
MTRSGRSRIRSAAAAILALALTAPMVIVGGSPTMAAPSRAELEAAQARLMELERDFQIVSERYNFVAETLDRVQFEIATKEIEVKKVKARLDAQMSSAVALARELYMQGPTGALEPLLSAESIAEIETRVEYLRSSEQAHSRVFERLAIDRQNLDIKINDLEAAQAEALTARVELEELREEIETRIALEEEEIQELNAAIEAAERRRAAREAEALAATIGVTAEDVGAEPASNPRAQAAVDAALSQVGKPYQWAGSGPDSYDCSGLTMWAWAQAGVSLPHNSSMQYGSTARVPQDKWEPGDLLFFGSPIHHVGMYIGNGQMVEAPYSGQNVRVNSAFRSDYAGAGRPGV